MKQKYLQFYYIDQEYIKNIRIIDEKIPTKNRPYIGIILNYKEYTYLAPLYSAKEKHKDYYMNNTFFRIYDYYNNYIGLIRFSNMIPVPSKFIKKINCKSSQKLYQEYFYISKHINQIKRKALFTYKNYKKFQNICIDFKNIEKRLEEVNVF